MWEIGSEFWDVPVKKEKNSIFPESTQWFLAGRSALQAVIYELKECHTVAMPSWCCDSMVKPFIDAGMNVCFYPVYWQCGLIQEMCLDCDVLFIMDYFGYTSSEIDLSTYKGIVIRDLTHSIFSKSYSDADYYFGSLRKWCGIWSGGYSWTKDNHAIHMEQTKEFDYFVLRQKAMRLKRRYINSYVDNKERGVKNKDYLEIYNEAENCLEDIGIASAAVRDIWLARQLDNDYIKMRRRDNAEILQRAFPDWLIFSDIKPSDCPMFVPILVPDGKRNALQRYLSENEIYCPVHWPVSRYHKLNEKTELLYRDEISLVCDQRYKVDDMYRMVETIRIFMEE